MRKDFGFICLAAALTMALTLGACQAQTAAAQSPANATSVAIKDFAFQPATLTVKPGANVTWTNADDEPHTVTANDKAYKSTALDTGDHYSHVYAAPGTYHYFCSLHPHMTGTIIVKP